MAPEPSPSPDQVPARPAPSPGLRRAVVGVVAAVVVLAVAVVVADGARPPERDDVVIADGGDVDATTSSASTGVPSTTFDTVPATVEPTTTTSEPVATTTAPPTTSSTTTTVASTTPSSTATTTTTTTRAPTTTTTAAPRPLALRAPAHAEAGLPTAVGLRGPGADERWCRVTVLVDGTRTEVDWTGERVVFTIAAAGSHRVVVRIRSVPAAAPGCGDEVAGRERSGSIELTVTVPPPAPTSDGETIETTAGSHGALVTALADARARWADERPGAHRLRVRDYCFCFALLDSFVAAIGGVAAEEDTLGDPVEQSRRVEALFALVEQAVDDDVASVRVRFHPELGYPVTVWIDRYADAIDDELGVEVVWFSVEG